MEIDATDFDPAQSVFAMRRDNSTVWLFSLVVLAPSLIFLWLWSRFGLTLPPINVDFLLVYIGAVLLGRYISCHSAAVFAVAGIGLVFGTQLFFGMGAIYIDDPALIREYLGFAAAWPWRLILTYAALAAVVLASLYAVIVRINIARAKTIPAVLMLVVLIAVNLTAEIPRLYRYVGIDPITSGSMRVAKLAIALTSKPRFTSHPIETPMMREDVLANSEGGGSILSIAVESLGVARDERFNAFVLKPLLDRIDGQYVTDISRHSAKGGTLTGELRELCSAKTAGTPTRANAEMIARDCLPYLLRAAGYATLAEHGNSGIFYNREQLYPALGFQRSLFMADLLKLRSRRCRHVAFEGICDGAVLGRAIAFTSGRPRRYAHVMTLDTHFPLAAAEADEDSCKDVPMTADPGLCLYAHQFGKVMDLIGRLLADQKDGPEWVYIFGDHPPPFVLAGPRYFFDREHVPYLVLHRRAER